MKSFTYILAVLFMLLIFPGCVNATRQNDKTMVTLPPPVLSGNMSVEETLSKRRSVRSFSPRHLSLAQLSQILWAAQGITHQGRGFRTAPSAGATFPLELHVIANNVTGLQRGLYSYDVQTHRLRELVEGDFVDRLVGTALRQEWISDAPVVIVISAEYSRTTSRYGQRGNRYVYMEVGHVGQNVSLQAVALGLGTTMVGAFNDQQLKEMLNLPRELEPLYIIPVGFPR